MGDRAWVKAVYFYREGDQRFRPLRMIVKPRDFLTMDALLDYLNKKIDLRNGVRSLFTPDGRHRLRSVDELDNEGHYVCSSSETHSPGVDIAGVATHDAWVTYLNAQTPAATAPSKTMPLNNSTYMDMARSEDSVTREIQKIEKELYGDRQAWQKSRPRGVSKSLPPPQQRPEGAGGRNMFTLQLKDISTPASKTTPRRRLPAIEPAKNGAVSQSNYSTALVMSETPRASLDSKTSLGAGEGYATTLLESSRVPRMRHWTVRVNTGYMPAGVSTSIVLLTVFGRSGKTPKLTLLSQNNAFLSGSTDIFKIRVPNVGSLLKIGLEISNSGTFPDWFCDNVILEDDYSAEKFPFLCKSWFSRQLGDCTIKREIPAVTENELYGQQSSNHVSYEVTVVTGDVYNAATSCKVQLTIVGDKGSSKLCELTSPGNHEREPFRKGQTDVFRLQSVPLGELRQIRLSHMQTSNAGGWFVDHVAIRENDLHTQFYFPAWRWLSKFHDGDAATSADLLAVDAYNFGLLQTRSMWPNERWKLHLMAAELSLCSSASRKSLRITPGGFVDARGDKADSGSFFQVYDIEENESEAVISLVNKSDSPTFLAFNQQQRIISKGAFSKACKMRVHCFPSRTLSLESYNYPNNHLSVASNGQLYSETQMKAQPANNLQFYCYVKGCFRDGGIVMLCTSRNQALCVDRSPAVLTALGARNRVAHFRVHKVKKGIRLFESVIFPGHFLQSKKKSSNCQGTGDRFSEFKVLRCREENFVVLEALATKLLLGFTDDGHVAMHPAGKEPFTRLPACRLYPEAIECVAADEGGVELSTQHTRVSPTPQSGEETTRGRAGRIGTKGSLSQLVKSSSPELPRKPPAPRKRASKPSTTSKTDSHNSQPAKDEKSKDRALPSTGNSRATDHHRHRPQPQQQQPPQQQHQQRDDSNKIRVKNTVDNRRQAWDELNDEDDGDDDNNNNNGFYAAQFKQQQQQQSTASNKHKTTSNKSQVSSTTSKRKDTASTEKAQNNNNSDKAPSLRSDKTQVKATPQQQQQQQQQQQHKSGKSDEETSKVSNQAHSPEPEPEPEPEYLLETRPEDNRPTLVAAVDFDAEKDARRLEKAMKGLGSDDKAIVAVLCSRSKQQLHQVKAAYSQVTAKDLEKEIASETSGDLKKTLLTVLAPWPQMAAQAIKQLKNEALLLLLLMAHPCPVSQTEQVYKQLYSSELETELRNKTRAGASQQVLVSALQRRDWPGDFYSTMASRDAAQLHEALTADVAEDVGQAFSQLVRQRDNQQLKFVFEAYASKFGCPVLTDIGKLTDADTKRALTALVELAMDRHSFVAKLLYESMKGLGTRDDELIVLVASRCELDLANVCEEYQRLYSKSLEVAIASETSGKYETALLSLLNQARRPPLPPTPVDDTKKTPETPKPETPKVETPKPGETLQQQEPAPKVETPKPETPRQEESKEEPRKQESPKEETPKPEASNRQETPKPQEPVAKEPTGDDEANEPSKEAEKKGNEQQTTTESGNDSKTCASNSESEENKEAAAPIAENTERPPAAAAEPEPHRPTVVAIGKFNKDDDCTTLNKAMGSDNVEDVLVSVLTRRSLDQREQIRDHYKASQGKDLADDLADAADGNFLRLLLKLLKEPVQVAVETLNASLDAEGEDDEGLVEVVCASYLMILNLVKSKYAEAYDSDLVADVSKNEGNPVLRKVIVAMLNRGSFADSSKVDDDAKVLGDALDQSDTDGLANLLATRSLAQLKSVFSSFETAQKQSVDAAIRDKFPDANAQSAFLLIVNAIRKPSEFFAGRLNAAMTGDGPTNAILLRIIVSRCEVDLDLIKEDYQRLFGKSLEADVAEETFGDFEKGLSSLLKGNRT